MARNMHLHLSDFLSGYIAGLSAIAAPEVSRSLDEVARRVPDFDAETLEALWEDIAHWLDDGLAEPEVGARLAAACLATAES